MVFEIPEGVNVYDLIALAVIEQAARDANCEVPRLAAEAQRWLAVDGRAWWDILGLGEDLFGRLIGEGTAVDER